MIKLLRSASHGTYVYLVSLLGSLGATQVVSSKGWDQLAVAVGPAALATLWKLVQADEPAAVAAVAKVVAEVKAVPAPVTPAAPAAQDAVNS